MIKSIPGNEYLANTVHEEDRAISEVLPKDNRKKSSYYQSELGD